MKDQDSFNREKTAKGLWGEAWGPEKARALNKGSRVVKENLQPSQEDSSAWAGSGPERRNRAVHLSVCPSVHSLRPTTSQCWVCTSVSESPRSIREAARWPPADGLEDRTQGETISDAHGDHSPSLDLPPLWSRLGLRPDS